MNVRSPLTLVAVVLLIANSGCSNLSNNEAAIKVEESAKLSQDEARVLAINELQTIAENTSFEVAIPDEPLRTQILGLQSIHYEHRRTNGLLTTSGCRQHSCDEKSIIVYREDGKLLGAGIIHYHNFDGPWDATPRLAIFAEPSDIDQVAPVVEVWGFAINPGMEVTSYDWSAEPQ